MKRDVVIQSRIAPTAIAAGAATIATATCFLWSLTIWNSSEVTSKLQLGALSLFLLAIATALALVTWSKCHNRSLVILRADSITLFHNSWKGRSATLDRNQIAAIRVDRSCSDGEGVAVVVRLHSPPEPAVMESKVWSAKTPDNTLVYEYGDATMSSDDLELLLQLWMSKPRREAG